MVAEVALGGDTAVLTDRRVVVAGRNFEQSLPLAHIALVRVHFARMVREMVFGAIAILVALVLFAIASPVRNLLLGQSVAIEATASQERANSGEGQGFAQGMQRIMGGFVAAAGAIPVAGWLLVAFGAAKIALGIIGRTVVTIATGGGEVAFSKRGRDRSLGDFIAEVGRHLPAPARPAPLAAPPVPAAGAAKV